MSRLSPKLSQGVQVPAQVESSEAVQVHPACEAHPARSAWLAQDVQEPEQEGLCQVQPSRQLPSVRELQYDAVPLQMGVELQWQAPSVSRQWP